MPTVQVVSEVNIDLHTVLDGVARLDLPEMERFALRSTSLNALMDQMGIRRSIHV
jgi:hypothetical protein